MIKPWKQTTYLKEYKKGPNGDVRGIERGELIMSLRFKYSLKFNKKNRWGFIGYGEDFRTDNGYTLEKLIDNFHKIEFRPNQSQNVFINNENYIYGYIDNIDKPENYASRDPYVCGINQTGLKIKFYDDEKIYILTWENLYCCASAYIPKKVEYKIGK